VSTRLPEKLTSKELATCADVLASLQTNAEKPFIVTGNLPLLTNVKMPESFTDIQSALPADAGKTISSRLWYAQSAVFKPINARTVKTDLGVMTIVEFGLYQPVLPQ
jgi:hypothetical protein